MERPAMRQRMLRSFMSIKPGPHPHIVLTQSTAAIQSMGITGRVRLRESPQPSTGWKLIGILATLLLHRQVASSL